MTAVGAVIMWKMREAGYGDPALLKYIVWIASGMRQRIQSHCEHLRQTSTATSGMIYPANHCECDAILGDHYLHQLDEVFFPMDEGWLDDLKIIELAYKETFRAPADPRRSDC